MKLVEVFEISFLGHPDDDRANETSVQLRQAQGTFPSVFGRAIFHLVDMLEDENVTAHGASGTVKEIVSTLVRILSSNCILVSEAAQKALNTCLVEDPTLFIRFFFEKLSQKERRVSLISFFCFPFSLINSITDSLTSNSPSFNVILN